MDIAASVTRHSTGSTIVPGNGIQLTYMLTLSNTNEPDWNSDVAAVEPRTAGGDNFEVRALVVDTDLAAAGDDPPTFTLTANFRLIDGSLSDGINGSHSLNLTYTATVSNESHQLRFAGPDTNLLITTRIQILRCGSVSGR